MRLKPCQLLVSLLSLAVVSGTGSRHFVLQLGKPQDKAPKFGFNILAFSGKA